ncbi:hypothetical protein SprV_0401412900 [Sparganum proliferum]
MLQAHDRQRQSLALSDPNPGESVANIFRHRSSSKNGHELPPMLNDNKVLLIDDTDKAELFSAFFAKHLDTKSVSATFFHQLSDRTLSTIDVSSDLIKKHISRLKNSHCSGTDEIPNSIIKQAADLPILPSHLFSVYISKGFFPETWKTSIIIPVFKSGCRSDVNNYRGVHKTPSLAKLLERIIFSEILDFCLSNRPLSSSQHGFVPEGSYETCHLAFPNPITSLRKAQQSVVVIYFDLSNAFDKVPHRRLLVKLEALGIRSPLLIFIRSYLSNRYQKVMIMAYNAPAGDDNFAGYSYPGQNRIQAQQAQVNEVVDIMKANVSRVLERDQKLSDLDSRADQLQVHSRQFEAISRSVQRKYFWRNMKMWAIIAFVVIIIIIVIIIAATAGSSK